jgi:hypothetical protein
MNEKELFHQRYIAAKRLQEGHSKTEEHRKWRGWARALK